MPRKCSICTDKRRMEIGETIVAGEALRDIAIRFGKSTAAVYRHKSKCIKNKLVPAVRAEERIQEIRQRAAEGDLIEDLVELREMTREIAWVRARKYCDHDSPCAHLDVNWWNKKDVNSRSYSVIRVQYKFFVTDENGNSVFVTNPGFRGGNILLNPSSECWLSSATKIFSSIALEMFWVVRSDLKIVLLAPKLDDIALVGLVWIWCLVNIHRIGVRRYHLSCRIKS